jgi:hypothetical protein
MKKIILWSVTSIVALLTLVQCKPNNEKQESVTKVESSNSHRVIVKEIINATAYTYLLVTEEKKEYWIAIPRTEVKVGKTYEYEGGMEMKKFESKDLKRTFDSVFFVEGLIDPSIIQATANPKEESAKKITKIELSEGITLAKGAISVHDLFSGKDKLAGTTVILTGKVMKFMPEIMSKNWIHLQDGSSFNGRNDITITTLSKVKVDEIVSFTGKVVLNKDLGSGYKYDVLIEDATVIK